MDGEDRREPAAWDLIRENGYVHETWRQQATGAAVV